LSFVGMNFSLKSKVVVDTLNGGSIHNIEFGTIIQHCRQVISILFITLWLSLAEDKQIRSFMN